MTSGQRFFLPPTLPPLPDRCHLTPGRPRQLFWSGFLSVTPSNKASASVPIRPTMELSLGLKPRSDYIGNLTSKRCVRRFDAGTCLAWKFILALPATNTPYPVPQPCCHAKFSQYGSPTAAVCLPTQPPSSWGTVQFDCSRVWIQL